MKKLETEYIIPNYKYIFEKEKVIEEAALKAAAKVAKEAEEAAAALEEGGTENITLEQIALLEQETEQGAKLIEKEEEN